MNPHGTRNQPDDARDPLAHKTGAPSLKAGDPVPGLSSWLLERKLGGGGFGSVWLARHALDRERKPVAFKFCTDPEARHRLVTHERNVVARVMQHAGKHPNIVPLLEYNLDGDVPWLMYEYVEGGTLAALAEQWATLPLAKRLGRAVKVLHQIAGALAAMHRLNPPIVHRDLKPANVLMAGAVPRITDFGIGSVALPQDSASELTAEAAKLPAEMLRSGTKLYSSPQQRFGAPPSPRDDVFALGVIAYQLVTGDAYGQPGTDALADLRAQQVPTELASLIVRSTDFKSDRRPRDGGEWEDTLAALIARHHAHRSQTDTEAPSAPLVVPVVRAPVQPAPSVPVLEGAGRTESARTEVESVAVYPKQAPPRRGLFAVLVIACAATVVGLLAALSGSNTRDSAKKPPEQHPASPALKGKEEAPKGKPKSKEPEPKPKEKEPDPLPTPKEKEPEPLPKPKVATFPPNPKAGDEHDVELAPGTKMRFCYIPAGACQLGAPKAELAKLPGDTSSESEGVRGKFSTSGFWLGKYEVTQAEWAAVMKGTALEAPSEFRIGGAEEKAVGAIKDTNRFPVENVSWNDCQEFLKRANAYRGSLGYSGALDLPHEDEWEYACRGGLGNARPFYFGDWLNGTQANCDGSMPFATSTKGDFWKRPQPVGSYETKAPHPWKLCDVHGNVWEWCKNLFEPAGEHRALRSGSWRLSARGCRTAYRVSALPTRRSSLNGFRVIVTDL